MRAVDPTAADRLDRYWDELVRGRAVHPGGFDDHGLDPRLAHAVRRLHAGDDAPAPAPDFAERLRTVLGLAAGAAPPVVVSRIEGERAGCRRVLPGIGLPLAQIAAAAVIALAILGGRLLGYGGTDIPTVTAAPPAVESATAVSTIADGDGCWSASARGATETTGTATALVAGVIERSPTAPAGSCRPAP